MRISDWISDVCSSDLLVDRPTTELRQAYPGGVRGRRHGLGRRRRFRTWRASWRISPYPVPSDRKARPPRPLGDRCARTLLADADIGRTGRSEKHTSELQSLMRISYAVFCLKKINTEKYILSATTNNTS